MVKRVLSLFLAIAFCFSLVPASAENAEPALSAAQEQKETVPESGALVTEEEPKETESSAALQNQQETGALPAVQSSGGETGACARGFTCDHSKGYTDGKCNSCNAELAASMSGKGCTDLQVAIDEIGDTDVYVITLLADANGSYEVTKSSATTFKLNNKTLNEIVFSNNTNVAFNDNGKVNNVTINQLPVTKKPKLMLDGKKIADESSVSVYKDLAFSFETFVAGGWDGVGHLCIQKEGASVPDKYLADGECDIFTYTVKSMTLEPGTYEVWAEVEKDGYTRASEKYTLHAEANLSDAVVELNENEFTYTLLEGGAAKEHMPQIKSVKLNGKDLSADEYEVSGATTGKDAGTYEITITAKEGRRYTGFKKVEWKILPLELTSVVACDYIKNYDGTKAVTADNIGKNDLPPHFHYAGGPVSGIVLEYGKDYDIKDVSENFTAANAETHTDVSFTVVLKNSNYIFRDENNNNTKEKTVTQGMNIGRASLSAEYQPEAGGLIARNGVAHTYEYDVSKLLKNLPSGLDYGTKKFRLADINILDSGYIAEGTVSVSEEGILTVPVKEVITIAGSEIAIVRIKVVAENYLDFYVTVTVYARNKIVPTGEPVLDRKEITYGDKISSITLSGKLRDDVNNVEVEGTFRWNADGTPLAGTCLAGWTFTPTGDNAYMYDSVTGKATITVNKADLVKGADYTAPTAVTGLEYNDISQELITKGITKIGTMQYKLGKNGNWSDEIPKAANAGSYEVYYRVLGNENYNDTAEILVTDCAIAKMPLDYTVSYQTKVYDGKTDGTWESVKFMKWQHADKVVELVYGEDFTVGKVNFMVPDAGVRNYGGTSEVFLTDSERAKNYYLKGETASSGGVILPAPIENCHEMTVYIRYNDTSVHTYGASGFGAPNDTEYDVFTSWGDGSGYDITDPNQFKIYGKITLKLKDNLTADDIGKVCKVKVKIQTKDRNYSTDPDNKDTIQFTVVVVDKTIPELSVDPISVVYDGNKVSADSIESVGKATVNGQKISGTWSWKGGIAPTNVAESGDYTVVFTPSAEFADFVKENETKVKVTVDPKDIANAVITLEGNLIYNRNEQTQSIKSVISDGLNVTYMVADNVARDAGEYMLKITANGNFKGEKTQKFTVNKAKIDVKPKNVIKVYGDSKPKYELESGSDLISADELAEFAKTAAFASEGASETASVDSNGYEISVQLSQSETKNLILNVNGTGTLTVAKAPLEVKVNDVSRIYGEANPELSVSYSGFVNGENESVLEGSLVLGYDESINAEASVGLYNGVTKALGLMARNYEITYIPGDVTITKIPVRVSVGTSRKSYLSVVFDKSLGGLTAANFVVKDSEGNIITITDVAASSDNKTYSLSGSFETEKEYKVKTVLSGAAVDEKYQPVNEEIIIVPTLTSKGSGSKSAGTYTVRFETNGGSKISNQTAAKNSAIKEPAAPTKEGFDFAGWYADKELKTKYDFSEKVRKNFMLYAAWTEKDKSENQIILTIGEMEAKVFGEIKTNDVAPKIVNDRTMLPARFVAENLGADVSWNGEKELVTIKGKNLKTDENITILIYIGSDIAYVNGREIKLDSAAFVENDRTYTPVRFISEELGARVEWNETEQKVVITK